MNISNQSSLPAGIYILSITAGNNQAYSTKIIKY
ncbi:MAG: T9SS type A sorting domain-containing protein [Taibaiella sp.]|nr:T9SS type A sorting domain-containing protein [Taibaiella sp.]